MNTMVFVNATIGFSETLFLVLIIINLLIEGSLISAKALFFLRALLVKVNVQVVSGRYYCICIITSTVNRYEETLKLTIVSNIILI